MCKFISSGGGMMFSFKLDMIQSEPATTSVTMSTPNASASTLLVLSGPVVITGPVAAQKSDASRAVRSSMTTTIAVEPAAGSEAAEGT
jgi:hypothetical protein